jgi:hypothetical protein
MKTNLFDVSEVKKIQLGMLCEQDPSEIALLRFDDANAVSRAIFEPEGVRLLRAVAMAYGSKLSLVVATRMENSPLFILPTKGHKSNLCSGPFMTEIKETLLGIKKKAYLFKRDIRIVVSGTPEAFRVTQLIRKCLSIDEIPGRISFKVVYPGCKIENAEEIFPKDAVDRRLAAQELVGV